MIDKLYIWLGKFENEQEFNDYMDQSAYYAAVNDGEENPDTLCPFCREIGMPYDEDFMVMIYEEQWLRLLSQVPAEHDQLMKALEEKGITDANVLIYHDQRELEKSTPENTRMVTFLGEFTEESPTPLITDEETRFGYTDIVWVGKTDLSKEDFMTYFEQGGGFCHDVNVEYYDPNYLSVYFTDKTGEISALVDLIPNKTLKTRLKDYFDDIETGKVNVLVHYAQDGTPNAAIKPQIKVYPQALLDKYPLPKGYTPEVESYNGLKYIASFGWS